MNLFDDATREFIPRMKMKNKRNEIRLYIRMKKKNTKKISKKRIKIYFSSLHCVFVSEITFCFYLRELRQEKMV